MADMTNTPTIGKLEIGENKTDPMLTALLAGRGGNGLGGGQDGGLLLLLLLSMFNRGGFGMGGAVATEAVTSSKDVMAQLNTFQTWASTNASQLAQSICGIDKSICCSTRDVIASVNALTPQMFQQFSSLTHEMTSGFASLEKSVDNLSAANALAECQTQNLVNTSSAAVIQKLQECCCANQLANANQNALIEAKTAALLTQGVMKQAAVLNEFAKQTCDIKQTITADGQATRALIQSIETDRLRQELADTKAALSNCQQTGNFSTILNATQTQQTNQLLAAIAAACSCGQGNDKVMRG